MSIFGRLSRKSSPTPPQGDFHVSLRCQFCSELFTLTIRVNDTVAVAAINGLCPCCDSVSKLNHLEVSAFLQSIERDMANSDLWGLV